MLYLDPDKAVRGFIKSLLQVVSFDTPDGEDDLTPTIRLKWPRTKGEMSLPLLAVLGAGEVAEPEHIGEGDFVEDSEDEYESGTSLFSYGSCEVQWVIIGICQSDDLRDLMLAQCRHILRSDDRKTTAFEDYYDQPVVVTPLGFRRLENEQDAERGLYGFEIRGYGETTDVALETTEKTDVIASGEVED